jgi:probable rRNA maturation factor
MSLDVNVSAEGIRSPLGRVAIAEVACAALSAERVRNALVSITLLDRRAMARLNREHLDHAGPTDIISFGFHRATSKDPVVGDIYICPDVARENAAAHGALIRQEMTRLVIHGVLHILGYEHPVDAGREQSSMWKRQELLLRRLQPTRGARGAARR